MKNKERIKKIYVVRYFWDGNFHTVNVEAENSIDARLIALQRARSERDHHPYVLHIIQTEV